ncbi:unnamed protein product [Calypogeia fissa]
MDHKRGYDTSDQGQESTRVKRHKDLSYSQPSTALTQTQNGQSSEPQALVLGRHNSGDFDQRDHVQLASLERLRAIADNSAQCVDKLCGCNLQSNIEKSVEEIIYEEYLPVVLSQIQSRSDQSSKGPLLLTDKNSDIQCAICPDEKRFKGWEALLIHAAKFQKGNNHQHRGYYRAVREALEKNTNEELPLLDIDPAPTSPKNIAYKDSQGRWQQPVVIVDKDKFRAPSKDPQLQEVLAVYSTGPSKAKKKVVVIPASEVGYINNELLGKQSTSPPSDKPEDRARVQFMESRWPGAKVCKYESEKEGEETSGNEQEGKYPSWNLLSRTLQLGRPRSPREKAYNSIADAERALSSREELRLNKPLEENRHIFDERQFDSKVNALVKRWKSNFKGFDPDKRGPLMPAEREKRYFMARAPIKGMERDEKFKDEVDQYALLNPSCRNQVKKQLSVLEEHLRKDRLLWLQEVETVRQQFQHMADAVHDEQVERDAATMRIEKHMEIRMKSLDEQQRRRREYFMSRKVLSLHKCNRLRREADMKGLMDIWRDEQRVFERECKHARFEKEKLESLHMKIHCKARQTRKIHCPICKEKLSWPLKSSTPEQDEDDHGQVP